jgi:hypothetical protein
MHHLRFSHKGPLYAAAMDAFNAVHALNIHLQYASIPSGVGMPEKSAAEERPRWLVARGIH